MTLIEHSQGEDYTNDIYFVFDGIKISQGRWLNLIKDGYLEEKTATGSAISALWYEWTDKGRAWKLAHMLRGDQ